MRLEYFQMVDKVLALDLEARTLRTANTVPDQSPIFEGHFPGHPLLPGVLLFEIMAQTSGMLLLRLHNYDRMAFLATVDKGKLRTFVTPGQVIEVFSQLVHDGSGFARLKAEGRVEGKLVCNAEVTLKTMPFPAPELRGYLLQTAERIGMPMDASAPAGGPAPASVGNLTHV
ncbi:3-hydroxyacyl-ACP dehydratase FabZ family protein [Ancylobacter oerskovii]|uniref:3-hydroxyacyl-ACP dehydratase FabZ family protein n=1 Tax=Ancylobacter oerskovii TaxID=459519 RepID=A0ABW4YZK7_9HYPH|nr:3-hydroxyacyl-ACP dehydratase FabZ family protein [Ancylobacter oerskovii]MBS7541517.1 beta-hydroxyacyl-ACP dehydratase [Ancylobacter oerskovii]